MNSLTSPGEELLDVTTKTATAREERNGRIIVICLLFPAAAVVLLGVGFGIVESVRQSRRDQCAQQLKRLGHAMLEFNEKHGHFPAPAITSAGQPILSWRVALLPFLGYRSLYERFHLDEPWDSPHNRALLGEMPAEFACPGGPWRRQGRTGYQVVVGPKSDFGSTMTAFEPTRGVDIREVIDGTSNSVLIVETARTVPWTKPEDLQWTPGGPLPGIASPHAGGAHALFVDGSTHFLKPTIDPRILLGLLTIDGSEVLSET